MISDDPAELERRQHPEFCFSQINSTKFSMLLQYPVMYRGFIPKPGGTLGYNIIVVLHLLYGLKRCSGTFGSILDLKEGVVQ